MLVMTTIAEALATTAFLGLTLLLCFIFLHFKNHVIQ